MKLMTHQTMSDYGNFSIQCRLVLLGQAETAVLLPPGPKVTDSAELLKGFGRLLESGKRSDVTLVVDGTEIPAHRLILCARSAVFDAMFGHEMKESLEGVVRVSDVSLPVFREVLRFIYTGECNLDNLKNRSRSDATAAIAKNQSDSGLAESKYKHADGLVQLVAAADRYQIPDLVACCVPKLIDSMTAENATERFALAEDCSIPKLKEAAVKILRDVIAAKSQATDLSLEQFQVLLRAAQGQRP